MNKEKQNKQIAKFCGWKWIFIKESTDGELVAEWVWVLGDIELTYENIQLHDDIALSIPFYTTDLNAMHGAEKMLTRSQLWKYHLELAKVKGLTGNNHWLTFMASAEQRAEVFLKVLNLWEEE